jgi:hypothetical protein
MKIYSTGLGMTLTAHVSGLEPDVDPNSLIVKIESTEPLPMDFICRVESSDIRTIAGMATRPAVMSRMFRLAWRSILRRNKDVT